MTILHSDLDRVDFSDIEDTSVPRVGPIHPGEILRDEFLEPMGITPDRAALDLAMPVDQLMAILADDRPIAADTGLRLARYFGVSAESWINLQAQYDLELAIFTHGDEIARQVKPRDAA
jgi:antitoxin HigA-1